MPFHLQIFFPSTDHFRKKKQVGQSAYSKGVPFHCKNDINATERSLTFTVRHSNGVDNFT